ncbi:10284_t:CDS:2, partial [Paraglomus occultum]
EFNDEVKEKLNEEITDKIKEVRKAKEKTEKSEKWFASGLIGLNQVRQLENKHYLTVLKNNEESQNIKVQDLEKQVLDKTRETEERKKEAEVANDMLNSQKELINNLRRELGEKMAKLSLVSEESKRQKTLINDLKEGFNG